MFQSTATSLASLSFGPATTASIALGGPATWKGQGAEQTTQRGANVFTELRGDEVRHGPARARSGQPARGRGHKGAPAPRPAAGPRSMPSKPAARSRACGGGSSATRARAC
eukprot:6812131-Alexandrium_andersonii.AAC.1